MTIDHRVEQLQREFGYQPDVALAVAEADGFCQYCGEDLLASRPGYSSISLDHLIPAYDGAANNYVLACSSCNRMKSAFKPVDQDEDPDYMLREDKDRLIQRVRTHLQKKILARKSEWYRARDIIRGTSPLKVAQTPQKRSPFRSATVTPFAMAGASDGGTRTTSDGGNAGRAA